MIDYEVLKKKITREQWVIINQMNAAIMNLNAVFCGDDQYSEEELDLIAEGIAIGTAGKMALEDAIYIIEKALEIKVKKVENKC